MVKGIDPLFPAFSNPPLLKKKEKPVDTATRVNAVFQQILQDVQTERDEAPQKNKSDQAILVGGDILTLANFGMNAAMRYCPALTKISALSWSGFFIGEIAGAINIAVSLVSLKQAIKWKNAPAATAAEQKHNTEEARRLFWDALFGIAIGIAMMLASGGIKIWNMVSISAILSNPVVFPLLFLLAMGYIVKELVFREKLILTQKDLGSTLSIEMWRKNLTNEELPHDSIPPPNFWGVHHAAAEARFERLVHLMSSMEAQIGIDAAIAATNAWHHTMTGDRQAALADLDKLENAVKDWNHAQHKRSLQQGFFLLGTLSGLAGLFNGVSGFVGAIIGDISLLGGNGIGYYLDRYKPFHRNARVKVFTKEFCHQLIEKSNKAFEASKPQLFPWAI